MAVDPLVGAMERLDERFQRLTGRVALGYISYPTPASVRVAFGDGTVCTSLREARDYMASLVFLAENEPGRLPYPFDQPLTAVQDLRVINGWPLPGEPGYPAVVDPRPNG